MKYLCKRHHTSCATSVRACARDYLLRNHGRPKTPLARPRASGSIFYLGTSRVTASCTVKYGHGACVHLTHSYGARNNPLNKHDTRPPLTRPWPP